MMKKKSKEALKKTDKRTKDNERNKKTDERPLSKKSRAAQINACRQRILEEKQRKKVSLITCFAWGIYHLHIQMISVLLMA